MKPNPKPTRLPLNMSSTSPQPPVSPLCAAAHGPDPAGLSLAPSTEICSKLHIQATHQFDLVLSTHKFKKIAYEKTTTTTTSLYVQLLYDVPCTVLVFSNFPALFFTLVGQNMEKTNTVYQQHPGDSLLFLRQSSILLHNSQYVKKNVRVPPLLGIHTHHHALPPSKVFFFCNYSITTTKNKTKNK